MAELAQRLEAREHGPAAASNGGGKESTGDDDGLVARTADEEGLTTKELAVRRGTSLWAIERSDSDQQDRARPPAEFATSSDANPVGRSSRSAPGSGLILSSLTVLVVIRFFTEVIPVLPRPIQFVDIPILVVIIGAAILRPRADSQSASGDEGRKVAPIIVLGFLFLVVCAASILTNLSRIDLAPALVFVYGFLGPLALFVAVYRLWPVGSCVKLSRLLVSLGLVQLGVAFAIDLPLFIAEGNPDVFSGTFGENAYQLVFFLLVLLGLLAGIFTFEKQRAVARFVPLLFIAILLIIFLAQYRSLLLTMVLTVVLLGAVLTRSGGRGAIAIGLAAAALVATLAYAAQTIPSLKFGTTIEQARDDPTFYLEKRLDTVDSVVRLFGDEPRYTITGTGPGTYSSRAWRTFSSTGASDKESAGAGGYALQLTGAGGYSTDVADKYVVPELASEIIGGSRAVSSPLSSYLSLLAEVGVVGFVLLIGAYAWALLSSLRMAWVSVLTAKLGDPLPAVLCATTVAFFVLLQMAVLENWLEVTRLTFISWILFAVATKEFRARFHDA